MSLSSRTWQTCVNIRSTSWPRRSDPGVSASGHESGTSSTLEFTLGVQIRRVMVTGRLARSVPAVSPTGARFHGYTRWATRRGFRVPTVPQGVSRAQRRRGRQASHSILNAGWSACLCAARRR